MTDFKRLDDTVTVSTQMSKEDFDTAAKMGVNTIICNRVEGEEAGMPMNMTMMSYAADHGMDFIALPVGGEFPIQQASELAALLREPGNSVHAYCKSGTRSAMLWGLACALNLSKTPDEIIQISQNAGFDLSNLEPAFKQFHQSAQQAKK
jgi:uncharacterized protein (TIGR01244 family)